MSVPSANPPIRVLLVDDEPSIRRALRTPLNEMGFVTTEASRGEEAIQLMQSQTFDVVLLDINMPGIGGMKTLARLRSMAPRLPILMLTVVDGEEEKVEALECGADDYITKPFSMDALLARMRALLRRSNAVPAKGQLMFHDITMDLAAHRVSRNGRPIHLGPTEFRLMEFFMQHPRRVFSREELLDAVWGPDIHVEPRTVDVHIRRLRKSINAEDELDIVRTVRAAGYALDTEPV
jgi:two-component system phosphate regulon response regulator PhoB